MSPPVIYRCAFIVRGRGQSHLDELLPAFALAVEASTPLPREEFITKMRSQIQSLVPGGVDDKTADNYRTETIGQILGMYYYDDNDVAQISPRTKQYIETQDQVQFFKNIFVTDITDVTLLTNPFIDSYFIENPTAIFCGDEPKTLNNDWMRDHSTNLRNNISDYAEYESKFGSETLLNCGVIGSKAPIFFDFIKKLCVIHETANSENQTAFTGDMGAFNYLARTQFNGHLRHGAPVNTVFKMYENERLDCWFRHK
jgi:hypothetical protein